MIDQVAELTETKIHFLDIPLSKEEAEKIYGVPIKPTNYSMLNMTDSRWHSFSVRCGRRNK